MKLMQTEVNMHNIKDKEKQVHKVVMIQSVKNKSTRYFWDAINDFTVSTSNWVKFELTLPFLLCIFFYAFFAQRDKDHLRSHTQLLMLTGLVFLDNLLPGDLSILQIWIQMTSKSPVKVNVMYQLGWIMGWKDSQSSIILDVYVKVLWYNLQINKHINLEMCTYIHVHIYIYNIWLHYILYAYDFFLYK